MNDISKKIAVVAFILLVLFPFSRTNAQDGCQVDFDTAFCLEFTYWHKNYEPKHYTYLLSYHDECLLDFSDFKAIEESLKEKSTHISSFFWGAVYEMVKEIYSDSLDSFQKEVYDDNRSKWFQYREDYQNGFVPHIKTDDYIAIAITELVGAVKYNADGIPIAVGIIKDIIPVCPDDNCINDYTLLLSRYCLLNVK